MKDLFPGYYQPDDDDFVELWDNAHIVLDANVLLDVFRYSERTSQELLDVIEDLGDRVWLPFHAALEFHENLHAVLGEQAGEYHKAATEAKKLLDRLRSERRPPFIAADLMTRVDELFPELIEGLKSAAAEADERLRTHPLIDRVAELFNGRVGTAFTDEELKSIHKEAVARYEAKVPPGFKDAGKEPEARRFGDYVIWREILRHADEHDCSVLFVTGDIKEDWFLYVRGRTLGPRPELVQEFRSGRDTRFYMYPTDRFLAQAKDRLAASVSEEAVSEARALQQRTWGEIHTQFAELRSLLQPSNELKDTIRHLDRSINLGLGPTTEWRNAFEGQLTPEAYVRAQRTIDEYARDQRRWRDLLASTGGILGLGGRDDSVQVDEDEGDSPDSEDDDTEPPEAES